MCLASICNSIEICMLGIGDDAHRADALAAPLPFSGAPVIALCVGLQSIHIHMIRMSRAALALTNEIQQSGEPPWQCLPMSNRL